jgi:membrane protein DedA with SNARE-associated domain/membrane-associated phospholipid phosphatase
MAHDWLQPILEWFAANPTWGGLMVFVVALGESLAIVGLFVPGAVLLFGFGALVAAGALDLWSTLAWAFAGAVVGDGISYWLGRHYNLHLRVMWPFRNYPRLMGRGVDFFHHHGGKSILFGRFVGPVRPIVPAVAGMLGMPPLRFLAVNVFSALLWAPAYLLPGVVFGASLGLAAEVASRLAVLLVLLLALVWLLVAGVHRLFLFMQPRAGMMILRLLAWGRQHPVLGELSAAVLDPKHPESRALLVLAAMLAALAWLMLTVLWNTLGDGAPAPFDDTVYHVLQGLRTPWADQLMVLLKKLGDPEVYLAVSAVVLGWLLLHRNTAAAAHWLAALAFGWLLTLAIRAAHHVPRPIDLYVDVAPESFPGGHAAISLMVYGFLAVLVARELQGPRGWIPYVLAGLLVLVIGIARLYLGLHWLSDVAGGIVLGVAWLALLGVAYRRHPAPPLAPGRITAAALATLIAAGAWHVGVRFEEGIEHYAVRHPVRALDVQGWWAEDWQLLPAYRIDLRGRREHPMTVQWTGPLEALSSQLEARGWRRPIAPGLGNALLWLSPDAAIGELPLLPAVHDGRHESLLLTHPGTGPEHQFVLRLWPGDAILHGGATGVYVGNVSEQRLQQVPFFTLPRTGGDFSGPLLQLQSDLNGLEWRMVQRALRYPAAADRPIRWHGEVLLARSTPPRLSAAKTDPCIRGGTAGCLHR